MSKETGIAKQLVRLPDVQYIQECFLGEEHSCLQRVPDGIDIRQAWLVYFCGLLGEHPLY